MSILTRNAPVVTVAAFAMLCLVVPSHDAFAASKKSPQAADAAAEAKKSYEGGVKAYQTGRFQNAVDQLSSALRGGGLSNAQMARGLYYRGLSYKRLDKPGLAISDLTSALWLKNGLSDDERKMATAERAEAYKSAGLGDGNSGAEHVARSDPKTETPAPAAAPVAVAAAAPAEASAPAAASTSASTAPQSSGGGVPQPLSMGAETAAVAPPPNTQRQASPPGVAAFEQSAVGTGSTSTSAGAAASSTGIGTFFSNLFSGGSSSTPATSAAEASGVTTASTSQAMPQSSSWANGAPVAAGAPPATPKATKTAAAEPVPAPVPAAAPASTKNASKSKTSSGKYKLHIAALRSRAAAEALAQKLMQEHANDLHDRQASVDEAVIGSMGTFYRVRVGSYKTAEEPRGLCNTLRNSGYDCLVVSN